MLMWQRHGRVLCTKPISRVYWPRTDQLCQRISSIDNIPIYGITPYPYMLHTSMPLYHKHRHNLQPCKRIIKKNASPANETTPDRWPTSKAKPCRMIGNLSRELFENSAIQGHPSGELKALDVFLEDLAIIRKIGVRRRVNTLQVVVGIVIHVMSLLVY